MRKPNPSIGVTRVERQKGGVILNSEFGELLAKNIYTPSNLQETKPIHWSQEGRAAKGWYEPGF